METCEVTRELKDLSKSVRTALDLYGWLLGRRWRLERTEYQFFEGRVRALIEKILSERPPGLDLAGFQREFRDLDGKADGLTRATERMIVFMQGAGPALEARTRIAGTSGTSSPAFSRILLDIGNVSYLVSVERAAAQGRGAPSRAWGIIYSPDRLTEDVLRPALREKFPSGETSWVVRARDGAVVLSSGSPGTGLVTYRANFSRDFPDWVMEFHQPAPRLIKTFLLSRRGLYFYMFLLIAGILIFGLALTMRSVSHELELARMKSDFVSTVSHEFKSPLTSIRQLAEMLQAGRVPSEERRQKYYDVLLEQSERLSLLTDNILSLARIEEGRAAFSFETTDISALLTDVITAFQERVRHEGFEIGLDVEGVLPFLAVDRAALSQALSNLMDNAVKYSGDSRRISVRAFLDGQFLAIAVRDFGVGIGAADLDKVFERFYRGGDSLTRTVKGSGLGLTLVKEIVKAHHGNVAVASEPGKGSVFTIRLPLPHRQEG
jgi:signal transduction histidine kinase